MAGGRVAGILVALAAAGPVSTWPDRLVEQCREVTEMTGVGIALSGAAGLAGILAATVGHAQHRRQRRSGPLLARRPHP